jgi:NADH:ubiquinone oxidoreductase subunit 5 (subunit L)/multisubunit Na+/H+ antiporter MnhA subunit
MRWTVGVLGVLAVVGGWIQFASLWHPLTDWLAPVAAPIAEASNGQETFGSILAVALGLTGIGIAWLLYAAKRRPVPKALPLLEKKFYWDELYDLIWYRTADLLARGLDAVVERPLIAGSVTGVVQLLGKESDDLGRVQNGLVRSYVLALASGLVVLAFVFMVAR